jgi:hypothetical protein
MAASRSNVVATPCVLFTILLGAALAGCGSETAAPTADGDGAEGQSSQVVVTTTEGDRLVFTDFEVMCADSEAPRSKGRVVSAVSVLGTKTSERSDQPILYLRAGETVSNNTRVSLPFDETVGEEQTFISAFITRAGKTDQLSSGAEGSSGDIEVIRASCEPSPNIDVRIDGRLESETYDGGHVIVQGHVRTN